MENSFFHGAKGATGLKSLDVDCEKHWIGWPGVCVEQKTEKGPCNDTAGSSYSQIYHN